MRAWLVSDPAGPPCLTDVAVPEPAPGQVLVRVHYGGLNFSDVLMVRGQYQVKPPLPFTPGQEVSGIVHSALPGSRFRPGDAVASKVVWGGFAEYVLANEDHLIALPAGLPLDAATALPVVWTTAWIALHDRAALRPGETVLVHAAAGGVGLAAVQLAANAGAQVIATAGSDDKLLIARQRGAHHALNYRDSGWTRHVLEITGGRGADVVVDPVGGDITDGSIKCLAYRGRLCIVGFAGGRIADIKASRLLLKNASAVGVYWSHERDGELVRRATAETTALVAAGRVVVDIGSRYPMANLMQALADLEERKTIGKSVLEIAGDRSSP